MQHVRRDMLDKSKEEPIAASSAPMARIVVVDATGTGKAQVESLIETAPRLTLVPINASQIQADLKSDGADVIIVEVNALGERENDILNEVRSLADDLPLIVVSDELDADDVRRLFKFSIHDWLKKPTDADAILNSIKSVVRQRKSNSNRVHAVISAVGGAGASTVATAMADIAATKLFKKKSSVALFDLDFSTGNCSYILNMVSSYNLGSVAASPNRVDAEFISVIQQKHDHGFFVYSFKRPELNTELNGYELVLRMLDAVSLQHDHTFLDIPYYETEWKDEVFAAVNTCTIVSEMNLPAIKHTLDLVSRIRGIRGEKFPIHVLFNKHKSRLFGQRIPKRKLNDLFEGVHYSYLPDDTSNIDESVDRGVPISDITGRSKLLKALTKHMKEISLQGAEAA